MLVSYSSIEQAAIQIGKKSVGYCHVPMEELRLVMVEIYSSYPTLQGLNNVTNFSEKQKGVLRMRHS